MESLRHKLREDRRRRRWRFIRRLIILIIIFGGLIFGWRFIHQPGFAYGSVEIHGTSMINESDVIKMVNSQPPFNLFNVSAGAVKTALSHDIRFTDVETEYKWPGILSITVKERQPAVYVANAYSSYLKVDFQGMVLGVTAGIPDAQAPMLVGASCGNVYIGDKICNNNVLNILQFLKAIGEEANDNIVEIVIDHKKNVRVLLKAGYPMLLGHVDQINKKTDIFLIVFNEVKNKNIKADYIDLTYEKPYVGFSDSNEVKNEISAKT